jgi:trehalose 6-phosphate phosphatase
MKDTWRQVLFSRRRFQRKDWHESEQSLTGETEKKLDRFFDSFTEAARPLLLLDYDGTLAPFRVDRFQARPWAGVRELLTRIHDQGRTRIVVITGRPAKEIAPLLGVRPALEVWGLHGAERLHTNGRREVKGAPRKAQTRLDKLGTQLRRDSLGGLFEEKANAAVMHWRGVPAAKAKIIEKRTRELFEPLARMYGLKLLEFEAGLELRAGPEKGDAVRALLNETLNHTRRIAAYLGDDLTDEAAFQAVKGDGLGVLVRRERRKSAADVWLTPPAELRNFLRRWLQACRNLDKASA